MYPEVGDFYDNDILPMMNGLNFGQPSAGGSGASAGGSIVDQIGQCKWGHFTMVI